MPRQPTKKQKMFAKEYAKTGNGVQSALKTYDTDDYNSARQIAVENLQNITVQQLIQSQAEHAFWDQIEIREELKESKKDYNVRSQINRDIMDRAGYKAIERSINIDLKGEIKDDSLAKEYEEKLRKQIINGED